MQTLVFLVIPVVFYIYTLIALWVSSGWLKLGRVRIGRVARVALMQSLVFLFLAFPVSGLLVDGFRRGPETLKLIPFYFAVSIFIIAAINYTALPAEDAEEPELTYLAYPQAVALSAIAMSLTALMTVLTFALLNAAFSVS